MNRRDFMKILASSALVLPFINHALIEAKEVKESNLEGMAFPFVFSRKRTEKPSSVTITNFDANGETFIERLFAWLN